MINSRINLAVIFGGNSVEHEISIISALQAVENFDPSKYNVLPVFINKDSNFYFAGSRGEGSVLTDIKRFRNVKDLLNDECVIRVAFHAENSKVFISQIPSKENDFESDVKIEVDIAFPIVHGTNVEDGSIQGFLKTLNIPFAGCDVLGSANGMDKFTSKILLENAGIPVLPCHLATRNDQADLPSLIQQIEGKFPYPAIVKPTNLGSSIGISKAQNRAELFSALEKGYKFSQQIIVEPAIQNLREINCSVLGDVDFAKASECEEPLNASDILSFEDKYMGGGASKTSAKTSPQNFPLSKAVTTPTKSSANGMASLSRQLPANLTPQQKEQIQTLAVRAFQTLNCSGVSRIDFIIDTDTDKIWLNEINTIPGSLSYYLWEESGIKYSELLNRLVDLALRRNRINRSLQFSFETNVLDQTKLGNKAGTKNASQVDMV